MSVNTPNQLRVPSGAVRGVARLETQRQHSSNQRRRKRVSKVSRVCTAASHSARTRTRSLSSMRAYQAAMRASIEQPSGSCGTGLM